MRPGAPLAFGMLDEVPLDRDVGQSRSAMVSFELFVGRRCGRCRIHIAVRVVVPVRLDEEVKIAARRLTSCARSSAGPRTARCRRFTGAPELGALTSMAAGERTAHRARHRTEIPRREMFSMRDARSESDEVSGSQAVTDPREYALLPHRLAGQHWWERWSAAFERPLMTPRSATRRSAFSSRANADDLFARGLRDGRAASYGADVWPSSIVLAEKLLERMERVEPRSTGLRRGPEHAGGDDLRVRCAIHRLLRRCARRYARKRFFEISESHRTRLVDWRHVPSNLGRFDLVFASDVLYEKELPLCARNPGFGDGLRRNGHFLLSRAGRGSHLRRRLRRNRMVILNKRPGRSRRGDQAID